MVARRKTRPRREKRRRKAHQSQSMKKYRWFNRLLVRMQRKFLWSYPPVSAPVLIMQLI